MAKNNKYLDDSGLTTLVSLIKQWINNQGFLQEGLRYVKSVDSDAPINTAMLLYDDNSVSAKLSHNDSGVTEGSYGDSSAQTPAFGETFKVNYETVNATGHVTALSSHNVTIPNTEATTSEAGLMSAEDKENLDNVSELADETYDMVMSGYAFGWLSDGNGNVILGGTDTGIALNWKICRCDENAIVKQAVNTVMDELGDDITEEDIDEIFGQE